MSDIFIQAVESQAVLVYKSGALHKGRFALQIMLYVPVNSFAQHLADLSLQLVACHISKGARIFSLIALIQSRNVCHAGCALESVKSKTRSRLVKFFRVVLLFKDSNKSEAASPNRRCSQADQTTPRTRRSEARPR